MSVAHNFTTGSQQDEKSENGRNKKVMNEVCVCEERESERVGVEETKTRHKILPFKARLIV